MSDVAISVRGLGKHYTLGAEREKYSMLRDQMRKWVGAPLRFLRGQRREPKTPFWALKDVSFEVKRGEVVGIIGRNGAGKSTLLKILSRITEPTEGEADIFGRVGSLLEVGTGFHPELTGRENVYLNGAILGMRRAEITRKFDEIVAFAEIKKFVDTPVKHYSSGMYMRLAFAVAAHLEPEILIVDEVLAVGDAAFQQKCLGKMEAVSKEGRTVLFVSHNMPAVNNLCTRVVLLSDGRKEAEGGANEMTARYLGTNVDVSEFVPPTPRANDEPQGIELLRGRLTKADGQASARFAIDEPVLVRITFHTREICPYLRVGIRVDGSDGGVILLSASTDRQLGAANPVPLGPGTYTSTCEIPPYLLNFGTYNISLASDTPNSEIHFYYDHALTFTLEPGLEKTSWLADGRNGTILRLLPWKTDQDENRRSRSSP